MRMKYKKNLLALFIIFVLLLQTGINSLVIAAGFVTEKIDQEEQKTFLSNIHLSMLDTDKKTDPIHCFDVNENGNIALGFDNSNTKVINVYNSKGAFLYGYSFESCGSFGIEWDSDDLKIYFVRSDIAAAFDKNGICKDVTQIQDSLENNSYWNRVVYATKRTKGDGQYLLKNDMGIFNIITTSYSQLLYVDETGKETILYDVNDRQKTRVITIFFIALSFVVVVIVIIISQFRKGRKERNNDENHDETGRKTRNET